MGHLRPAKILDRFLSLFQNTKPKITKQGRAKCSCFITLFFRYGSLPSQPHGSSKGIMNIQDHNFSLNRGEQIKSIKVFTSFESQFIIGLQFKTTTNRDSQIFGQNSRFNYEIKSPYSSRYFVEYLHGKSKIFTFPVLCSLSGPDRIIGRLQSLVTKIDLEL